MSSFEGLVDAEILKKFKTELFGIIVQSTTGEANVVVRGVPERGCLFDGFAAILELNTRFNPHTPTRILQFLTVVVSPPPIKDIRFLAMAIETWEAKRHKLKNEFQEEFSDAVQVAILVSMLPKDLQDVIFQMGHGEKLKYLEVRDKVMGIANHRSAMSTPTPMDIGSVPVQGVEVEQWGEYFEEEQFEVSVDAVQGKCFRCGGWGHMARNCATPMDGKGGDSQGKGGNFGKGGNSYGKGGNHYSKGGNYGKGGNDYSKGGNYGKGGNDYTKGGIFKGGHKGGGKGGKGYQGTCFNCGKVGHKAWECKDDKSVNGVESEEVFKEIGGIWMIGCVGQTKKNTEEKLKINNMFNALEDNNDDDEVKDELDVLEDDDGDDEDAHPEAEVEVAGVCMKKANFTKTFKATSFPPISHQKKKAICNVGDGRGKTFITVDSAAEESVCPKAWGDHFGTEDVRPGEEMRLVNANGGKIAHYGSRRVAFKPRDGNKCIGLDFEVTDVKKPLVAVFRICEKGNLVQFGPKDEDNFVKNIKTQEKIMMKKEGNSYVMEVDMLKDCPFQGRVRA